MAEDNQTISSGGAGEFPVSGEKSYDGRFDCKLCKDLARDAVVSFCGHLFCWSCMVQHLKKRCRFCPVCHEQVSATKVIPIYGGGGKGEGEEEAADDGVCPRPGPPLVTVKRQAPTVKRRHLPTKQSDSFWFPIREGEDDLTSIEAVRSLSIRDEEDTDEDEDEDEYEYLVYTEREWRSNIVRKNQTKIQRRLNGLLQRNRTQPV